VVVATVGGTRLRATAASADGSTAPAAVALGATTSTWSPRCGLDHPTPRPAATTRCTVQVAGTRRTFVLSTPSATGPAALVVAFHGLRQTAATFAGLTGLVASARAAGLVLALPESDGPAFNDGRLGAAGPDDDAFFVALVHQLVTAGMVDPRRVVVTGFSNGAGMAMRVAGAHPGTVAALVSIDGSLIDAPGAPRPTGAVRTVLVHGTADTVQPWRGRPAEGPLLPAYIPVPATQAAWVTAAGAGPKTVRHLGGTPGRPSVSVTTWAPGRATVPVTAYTVAGMGHVWPVATVDTVDATQLVTRVAVSLDPSRAAVAATIAVERAAPLGR
jgi:polyhydroxybutyrate depolymerase